MTCWISWLGVQPQISPEGGLRGLWVSPSGPLTGTVLVFGQQRTCTFRLDSGEEKLGVPLGHIIPGYITSGDFQGLPRRASIGNLRSTQKLKVAEEKALSTLLVRRLVKPEDVVENGGRIIRYDLTVLGWYLGRWAGWL